MVWHGIRYLTKISEKAPDTRIPSKDMKPTTTKAKVLCYVKHLYWFVQASNHWLLIDDQVDVNVGMDEVAVS